MLFSREIKMYNATGQSIEKIPLGEEFIYHSQSKQKKSRWNTCRKGMSVLSKETNCYQKQFVLGSLTK